IEVAHRRGVRFVREGEECRRTRTRWRHQMLEPPRSRDLPYRRTRGAERGPDWTTSVPERDHPTIGTRGSFARHGIRADRALALAECDRAAWVGRARATGDPSVESARALRRFPALRSSQ